MKTDKRTAMLVLLCALSLGAGCATVKDSARDTAGSALKSADLLDATAIGTAVASGNYEAAFKGVASYAKRVKAEKARADGTEITEAKAAAALQSLGYEISKTVFFDGIAVNDLKRITWEKKLVQTGSGAETPIEVVVSAGDGATLPEAGGSAEPGEIDWMDVILKQAEEAGVELE